MAVEQFLYLVRELDLKTLNLIVMLVAVGAGVSGATGKAQDVANPIEVDAIKALMEQTTETFNRHDAKAWARFCAPYAQLVTVRGESMKGVSEVEKGLATVFETRARRATLERWTFL